MHYRTLGRTGIQVSPYALGTLMFATTMGNAPEDSARIIGAALDAGINLIDTADAYGDSEDVVGKALHGRRDDVVLATKFGRPTGQGPNRQGASRRWIITAVENSLRLNRGIEREILPTTQRFGMGTLIWGPLGQGLLTGRVRKNQDNDLRRAGMIRHLDDERRLDAVEKLIPLAAEAGLPMTHLAMAFTIAHPGVTSALIGVRTMHHLDALLAGLDVTLSDDILDRIDDIVAPGTDVGTLDQAHQPPALADPGLRRRPPAVRAAA